MKSVTKIVKKNELKWFKQLFGMNQKDSRRKFGKQKYERKDKVDRLNRGMIILKRYNRTIEVRKQANIKTK